MGEMRKHVCAATLCTQMVPERYLMCRPHWVRVPAEIQGEVWTTYRKRERDRAPYDDAVRRAVEAVREYG